MSKLIRLDVWLVATYGNAIALDTAYRWVKAGKIQPPPQKHGRAYFVHPEAVYTDRPAEPGDPDTLLDRIRAREAKALAH